MKVLAAAVLLALAPSGPSAGAEAASAEPMAVTFSWRSVHGCTEEEKSPAFQVKHAPGDTRFLIFALAEPGGGQPNRGQYVNYPADGNVQAGAVSYMPPCRPGLYRWTVTATNRSGDVLAKASADGRFPAE